MKLFIDELEHPRKRPRSVPVVLVPTLADVRRRTGQVEDIEEVKADYKKLKLLKNVSPMSNDYTLSLYQLADGR